MKPINPYAFQGHDLAFVERLRDGNYRICKPVEINLGYKPKMTCAGEYWALTVCGILYVYPGFEFNGPSVIADLPTRMLASLVHDILCDDKSTGAYSYYRKQKIFSDIEEAQGEPWIMSSLHLVGLLAGNWAWRAK